MVEAIRNVMSYGYQPPQNNTPYSPNSHTNKLYHQDEYRTDSRSTPSWHRHPLPNYSSSHYGGISPGVSPPPPSLTPHPSSEGTISSGCMCTSCNRPPQYHPPSLPHLPHYSSQPSWISQQQSFSPPIVNSSGGVHNEHQSPSWSPGMAAMTAYERNNNEPSMVSSNRFAQMQDPGRYATPQESTRYSSIPDSNRYSQSHDSSRHTLMHDTMPLDPREWSASDVQKWIQWASFSYKLKSIPSERFQMNGKALCLMDLSMFMFRVPDGGERLYDDFQTRLKKALCQDQPPKIT